MGRDGIRGGERPIGMFDVVMAFVASLIFLFLGSILAAAVIAVYSIPIAWAKIRSTLLPKRDGDDS